MNPFCHARFKHVEGAANVNVKRGTRVVVALEQPKGSEMEHTIGSRKRALQYIRLQNIATNLVDLDAGVAQRPHQIVMATSRKVVVDDDLANVGLNQVVDGVGADQARTTDDHNFLSFEFHLPQGCILSKESLTSKHAS